MTDYVMDLLDELDVKQSQKQKPKKSNARRKEKKATGEDILGFLDELEAKKTPEPSPTVETTNVEKKDEKKETDVNSETHKSSEETKEDEGSYVDPMATVSAWWSRNKGGLWSRAQETLSNAAQDAVNQARQAEQMVDKSAFSLNALQSRITSVINTIVPPISRHEQLKIYVYHDMVAYPSVDKLLYEVFDYVMDQVEGGGEPQLVSEKGEKRLAVESQNNVQRKLNYVSVSLPEAVKIAKDNIEPIKARVRAENGDVSEDELKRTSQVFLSIQPVVTKSQLLSENSESLHFVIVLDDSEHNVELSTVSQPLPVEWAHWLDSNGHGFQEASIDPREWVFGWVEDALNLSFGVIAQKYVTTRMGLTHLQKE